jgi:hypothetical protein
MAPDHEGGPHDLSLNTVNVMQLCFGSDRATSPLSAGVPCGEKYLIALRFAAINLSGIEIRDSFDIVPLPVG